MHSAHQVHQQVCTSCTRAQGATRKGAQEGCCRVSPQCSFGCMASSPLSTRTQNEEDRSLEYAAVGRVFSLRFFPRTEPKGEPKGRRELLRIPFVFCFSNLYLARPPPPAWFESPAPQLQQRHPEISFVGVRSFWEFSLSVHL